MRIILLFLCFTLTQLGWAEAVATTQALETTSIKVEYIETTQRGIVYVFNCEQCTDKFYSFDASLIIKKNGEKISIDEFSTDYWNAKFPTIFLDPESKLIVEVSY
mgnify:CR=1 FL=1